MNEMVSSGDLDAMLVVLLSVGAWQDHSEIRISAGDISSCAWIATWRKPAV